MAKSRWGPFAVIGRAVWGRDGFGGAMRKTRRELIGPRTVARAQVDPLTGKLKTLGLHRKPDGTIVYKPPRQPKPKSRR